MAAATAAPGRLRALLLGAGGLAAGAWLLRWLLRKRAGAAEGARELLATPTEAPEAQAGGSGRAAEEEFLASPTKAPETQAGGVGGAAEEAASEPAPLPASLGLGLPERTGEGGGGLAEGRPSTAAGGRRRGGAGGGSEPSQPRDLDSGRPATAADPGLGSEGSAAAWHFAELPLDAPPAAAAAEGRPATAGGAAGGQPAGRRRGAKKEGAIAKGFFNKSPKRKEPAGAAAPPAPPAPQRRQPLEEEQGEVGKARAEGLRLLREGSHAEAQAAFRQMRQLALEAGQGRAEGRALCLLARALEAAGAAEPEVEDAYKQALKIAHNQDDMELSFSVLTGMGSHALQTGDADLAEHFYLQSQTLARRVLTEREEAVAEGNLGRCLAQVVARRPEALEHFRRATALQERAGTDRSPQAVRALHTALDAFALDEGLRKEAQGLLKRVAPLSEQAREFEDWEIDL